MSISLSLHAEGLETVNDLIHYCQALGAKPGGVNLLSHPRAEGGPTSAQLLKWHAHLEGTGHPYPKRDFVTNSKSDNEEIAKAYAKTLDEEMKKFIKQKAKWEKLKSRSVMGQYTTRTGKIKELKPPPDKRLKANAWLTKAHIAGMKIYMEQVHNRIERELSNTGDVPELSESYTKRKREVKGFIDMMKWTGQILDNLDFGGVGGKNIRVTKK